MRLDRYLPRTLDAETPKEVAVVRERGYQEGIDLARIEAHTQVRLEMRQEMEKMAKERDEALARASGADAEFEADRQKVRQTLEELQTAAETMRKAVEDWQTREATAVADVQHQAIGFALEVAAMIVESMPVEERIKAALQECAQAGSSSEPVRLRVHPSCVRTLQGLSHGWEPSRVTVVPDPAVTPGDVVCETGSTRVEAGLAASMTRIRRVLGVSES